MVPKERCIISGEETNEPKFYKPELLKSGSNGRRREFYRRHIREMGPICRPRFKTFKEEDGEFADTLRKAELLDHDNCMWLSSDGASSSPTSCLQDNGLFGSMDLKIDAWFISLLSTPSSKSDPLLSTKATFFDGSRVNPIEEASLVLDQRKVAEKDVGFQENLEEEEEVISWLVTSIKNESQDTHEDAESFYSRSSVKDSQSEWSTPVTKSYQLSTSSVSSITDTSDNHSAFSSSSSSDYSSEVVDLEEIGTEKPLFWPFDSESDWSSETKSDLFIMSPRKNIHKSSISPKTAHSSFNPRLPNGKLNPEKVRKEKLVFSRRSKPSADSALKQTNGDVKRLTKSMSLQRLRKSTKTSTKPVPVCKNLHLSASCISSVSDTSNNEHNEHSIVSSCYPSEWNSNTKSDFFEWDSDTKWDFFDMSPRRKDIYKVIKSPNTSPDTAFKLRLGNENTNSEISCTRKLEFSTTSNERPKSTKTEVLAKKPFGKHKIVLEDLLLVEKLNIEGGAIEDVLGLREFDGHEGIESKFNKDEFLFCC